MEQQKTSTLEQRDWETFYMLRSESPARQIGSLVNEGVVPFCLRDFVGLIGGVLESGMAPVRVCDVLAKLYEVSYGNVLTAMGRAKKSQQKPASSKDGTYVSSHNADSDEKSDYQK